MKSPTALSTLATVVALTILQQNSFSTEVDPTFSAQVNGTVYALHVDASGNVYAGGQFNSVNGSPRNNLARLNPSGAVDASFAIQPDAAVLTISADNSGSIYAGGAFNAPSRHLAKISSGGQVLPLALQSSTSSRIDCLALSSDGSVVIGGPFRSLAGTPAIHVAKISSAGQVDSAFESSLLSSAAFEAGADALAIQSDGKILVGGYLNTADGQRSLLRLNADGSVDATFSTEVGSILYTKVSVSAADNKILVAGVRSSGGEGFVRRLNGDGTVDLFFHESTFNGSVEAIALLSDGSIIAAGSFSGGLAKLNPDGSLDMAWNITTDGPVRAVAATENQIIIGGAFTKVGNRAQRGIARINLQNRDVVATSLNGKFQARITGEPGKTYEIEATEDFQSWTSLGIAIATEAGIQFADPNTRACGHRFFRARLIE
ncbi:MAG TPA: hypothetical protein VF773_13595 [Verrucomicrobiae bacterium]